VKTYRNALIIAGLSACLCSGAEAAVTHIKEMRNGDPVALTGTVDNVRNERKFTLRDKTGAINVDIISNQSEVLKKGDTVTVSGTVDKQLFRSDIDATDIQVNKNIAEAVGDMIEGHTAFSFEGATPHTIANLPKEGLVKVSGVVTDVDSEKKFTLTDDTGIIEVDMAASETAVLTEGAKVTVIGYVDNGFLGKDINAGKIVVLADAVSMR